MKLYNYIYKITNTVNGKIYIGKHSTNRMDDGYMGSGHRLRQAYKKYGMENFNKLYLAFCDTAEKLNWLEKFYIKKYHSNNLTIGYNLTYGGDGGGAFKGHHHTVETKRKISEAQTGKTITEECKKKMSAAKKGKPKTDEVKKKMSAAKKGQIPWNKDKKGCYRRSEETKRKLSESHKGVSFSEEHRRNMRLAWQRRKLAKLNQQIND